MDDRPQILTNHRIQITEISLNQLTQAAHGRIGTGTLYRPVAAISLALNWYFGQNSVTGYHIVNFLIHLSTAWVLFLTVRTLLSTPLFLNRYTSGEICFIAVFASLFWALNPLQTQAVTYIVQRMAALSALFSLLTLLCYLKARLSQKNNTKAIFFTCTALSFLLAIFSKENAVIIILTFPIFELLFFQQKLSRQIIKKLIQGILLGLVIVLLSVIALRPELFDFIPNYYRNRPFTLSERFLTEQRVVIFYLTQLFFPAPYRLSVEHDFILSTSLFTPWTTIAAICFNVFLVFFAVKNGRKYPLLSLAILFFYLNHIIESTIVPLELIFEHRNYLPSLFLFLPVVQGSLFLIKRPGGNKFITFSLIGTLTLLLGLSGFATYQRNKVWQTEESLWIDALRKAPDSARPLANLAIRLAWGPSPSEAKYRKALELTQRTLELRMSRTRLDAAQLGNMASIHNQLGEHNQALSFYKKAIALAPEDANIRYNYCKTLIMKGDFTQAKQELILIIERGFIHPDYFNMLGFLNLWLNQPDEALPAIQRALKSAPGRADILLTLSKTFSMLGLHNKAKWYLSLARNNGRDDAVISLSIIENALLSGNKQEAKKELQRSIDHFPLRYFLSPLTGSTVDRNRQIPLETNILIPYLQSELPAISRHLLP